MFVRNLLNAGDYVTVVPVGMNCILQYSENGILEKVFTGFGDEKVEVPELLSIVLKSVIPTKISIRGGTSWITGSFYRQSWKNVVDSEESRTKIIKDFMLYPEEYRFYAGLVESYAVQFRGSVPIRQWLSVSGFDTLPGYVISAEMTEDKFEHMIKSSRYPFEFPLISDYIVFRNGISVYKKTGINQCVVDNLEMYIDTKGYIESKLYTHKNLSNERNDAITIPYSDTVRFNIQKKSIITFNSDGGLIYSDNSYVDGSYVYQKEITCTTCGKKIKVPQVGRFTCSDSHCNSVLYPRVNQLLEKLGLKRMKYETYVGMTESYKSGFNISDTLEYLDVEVMDCKLADALRAIIPLNILPDKKQIIVFVKSCSYSVSTVKYYLNNPNRIVEDLGLDIHLYSRFINWLSEVRNVLDVESLLDSKKLNIYAETSLFSGPPIFRNKNIYLTGKFIHGSYDEVSKIIKSYSANIVNDYKNTKVDYVVVGDTNDGVNGALIRYARENKIPIFSEHDMFETYGINRDLEEME